MKYKTLFYLFFGLCLVLLIWNVYIFSKVSGVQDQLEDSTRENQAEKGFNEVLQYDLDTYKDSVRIFHQQIEELKNQKE